MCFNTCAMLQPCRNLLSSTQVKTRNISGGDSFLVLASDGVWEFMDNKEASYSRMKRTNFCVFLGSTEVRRRLVQLKLSILTPQVDEEGGNVLLS